MTQTNVAKAPTPANFTLVRQFQDVDKFAQAVLSQGVVLTQLAAEPFVGNVVRVDLGGISLVRLVTNCSFYASGPKPTDSLLFCTCLSEPKQPWISHRLPLPSQTLFGFDPTREVSLIATNCDEMATVIVPVAHFEQYLQEIGRDDLDHRFFQRNFLQIVVSHLNPLRAYLQQIFYLATTNPTLVQQSQALIVGDLLPLLVNCFSVEVCPNLRIYPFRRSEIVEQAEAFMLANLDQPLTLEAICQAVKTSKSALSYGFQEIFGLSPMAYLKAIRLHGVRRALKAHNPETASVLGIANHYGFWHMGHFSQAYKQMFGELPSETLKQ